MKYLIDGVTKSVLSLANQYKYLRPEDEYLVYDDTWSNIDGLDLVQSNNFIVKNGERVYSDQEDNDSRRMKITTDFETSLEWCDCYATFKSIPYEITTAMDLDCTREQLEAMLERLEKAKSLGKKIYLGNLFSEEFEEISNTYENCIHPKITKDNYEEIKDYSFFYRGTYPYIGFRTTMIIGTNSSSGKFSCALKVKEYYESLGEKVILIHTEETYPFLDDQNGTIRGFCRNFSDLNTDEDFMYFQAMVAKIYNEDRPDRIIFVTQSGFGLDGIINSYQDSSQGVKMKGLWDSFVVHAFGCNDVVVAANYNCLEIAERIIKYFGIQIDKISVAKLFINPRTYTGKDEIVYTTKNKKNFYKVYPKGDADEMRLAVMGMVYNMPYLDIDCSYAGINDFIKSEVESEDFVEMVSSVNASKLYAVYEHFDKEEVLKKTKEKVKNKKNKSVQKE